MADDDVSVKFGANTEQLNAGIAEAMKPVASFSQRVQELNDAMQATAPAMAQAGEAAAGLNFKTSGATQEFIRLGHEAMTGNFSRIPGSLIVLANRMGGLQTVMSGVTGTMVGWAAAIGGAALALYEWAAASERAAEAQEAIRGAMDATNQSASYNADDISALVEHLKILADVNTSTAEAIITGFVRAGNSGDELAKKVELVGNFASAAGVDAKKASADLVKIFEDPARGAAELAEKMPAIISANQAFDVSLTQTKEGTKAAADELQNILSTALDDFRINHLTPTQEKWETFVNSLLYTKMDQGWFAAAMGVPNQELSAKQAPLASTQLTDAQKKQEADNADNELLAKGLALAQQTHGVNDALNDLLVKRKTLIDATNVAMAQGGDAAASKLQDAIQDTDLKIAAEKKRLNAEATADAKKAAAEQIAIEREKADTIRQINSIELQTKKDALQAAVDAGQITKGQELAGLRELADQEYDLSYNSYLNELENDNLTAAEKQSIYDKIQVLYAKHLQEMASLDEQAAAAQMAANKKVVDEYKADWNEAFGVVDRALDGLLQGTLQGTEKWQQAVAKLYSSLALSAIEDITKIMLKWAALQAMQAIAPGSAITKGLQASVPSFLGGGSGAQNVAQTTATTANTAALTQLNAYILTLNPALAANTTATAAGTTATATSTAATTVNTSTTQATSAQGIVAWVANTAATLANTIALDIQAVGKFLGFDVGTSYVPSTGLAMIHQGEIILPPDISAQVRSGQATIGQQGALTGGSVIGGGGSSINLNVTALDAKSFSTFINNPSILKQMATAIGAYQSNNPSARPNY